MDTRGLCAVLFVLAFGLVAGACDHTGSSPASAAGPPGSEDGGTITGRVVLEGPAPAVEPIRMGFDPTCLEIAGSTTPSEAVLVGADGAVANAFVYIRDGLDPGLSFNTPTTPVTLDQRGCRFVPHVLGVRVGQRIEVVNSDPTEHNVHGRGVRNPEFIRLQPVQGMRETRVFTTPEVMVPITCDVHPWMSAYVGVLSHPFFAVTGTDGRFTLTDVPPGTYTLEVWHERFGRHTARATVVERSTVTADMTLFAD